MSQPAPAPFSPIQAVPSAPNPTMPPGAVMPPGSPPKKEIPATPNKVIGAKIVVQYRGEDGKIYESATTVDPEEYKVQSYALNVEEKHEKKRDPETKDIIGFEDTGERILKFTMRYHVR